MSCDSVAQILLSFVLMRAISKPKFGISGVILASRVKNE
jgi:hypothetical protein